MTNIKLTDPQYDTIIDLMVTELRHLNALPNITHEQQLKCQNINFLLSHFEQSAIDQHGLG